MKETWRHGINSTLCALAARVYEVFGGDNQNDAEGNLVECTPEVRQR
jgi:hypothetical protein